MTALCGVALGDEFVISNADEFIQFADDVNIGLNYSGTTVLLSTDIDLSGVEFDPIGMNLPFNDNHFNGTFDGQGHTISNLVMNQSIAHVGLFGYSTGLTIRNLVLDNSCSFTSHYTNSTGEAYVGGIIGHCSATYGPCIIENCVNKASVTFSGDVGDSDDSKVNLGGIAGLYVSSSFDYDSYVKGCVNYGLVTHNGVGDCSYVGGIAGFSYGHALYFNKVTFQSCANYGDVTFNGTSYSKLFVDGIVGVSEFAVIKDCKNYGKITPNGASGVSLSFAMVLFFIVLLI